MDSIGIFILSCLSELNKVDIMGYNKTKLVRRKLACKTCDAEVTSCASCGVEFIFGDDVYCSDEEEYHICSDCYLTEKEDKKWKY